ncbi:hypothetical protein PISMIDRAFT_15327 [Pisolithus microcarpus 441]|uniref:Uncharacterized protein n=1 Tax=Pisolithus microcarpus 441 TaxID=765257 RepID=A0A0C9YKK4_9AGAM|nr:hypothetical protein PISMIDRAFT_15327 [Pisolithus microcarpus 441]
MTFGVLDALSLNFSLLGIDEKAVHFPCLVTPWRATCSPTFFIYELSKLDGGIPRVKADRRSDRLNRGHSDVGLLIHQRVDGSTLAWPETWEKTASSDLGLHVIPPPGSPYVLSLVLIHLIAQKESDGVNRVIADALDIGDRVTRGTISRVWLLSLVGIKLITPCYMSAVAAHKYGHDLSDLHRTFASQAVENSA